MHLLAVGISHRTAPVDLRESVDFGRGGLETALSAIATRGVGREVCTAVHLQSIGNLPGC